MAAVLTVETVEMTWRQLLLALWLAGVQIRVVGDDLLVRPLGRKLDAEVVKAIQCHRSALFTLVASGPNDSQFWLPARDYCEMFWAPRPEWRSHMLQ